MTCVPVISYHVLLRFLTIHRRKLDPIHYSAPVLGEEQFFDVELDRHTQFLPESTEQPLPSWTVEGDILAGSAEARNDDSQEEEPGMLLF